MAKKQKEIPGTERPSIEAIDDRAGEHLEAVSKAKEASEIASDAKGAIMAAMLENIKQLEKDKDGNHIYPYQDGDVEKVFVLCHDDALRVRNVKKSEQASGPID